MYDKYYCAADNVEYGFFPWYVERGRVSSRIPFFGGRVLIFKDRNYEFDMRGILRCFYIVSHYFFALCCKFGVLIIDTSRVKVVSGGVNACLRKSTMPFYFKSWIKEGVRIYCIFFVEDSGRPFRFKGFVLLGEWVLDLFKHKKILSGSDTLICSEVF